MSHTRWTYTSFTDGKNMKTVLYSDTDCSMLACSYTHPPDGIPLKVINEITSLQHINKEYIVSVTETGDNWLTGEAVDSYSVGVVESFLAVALVLVQDESMTVDRQTLWGGTNTRISHTKTWISFTINLWKEFKTRRLVMQTDKTPL